MQRKVGDRPNGQPHVVSGTSVADVAHNLHASTSVIEPLSCWILPAEKLFGKRFIHNRDPGIRVGASKVPAIDQRNPHRIEPAWRDTENVRKNLARGAAVNRACSNRALPAHQGPYRLRHRLHTGHPAQMLRHLVPIHWRLRALRDGLQIQNPFRGKAGGLARQPVERGHK